MQFGDAIYSMRGDDRQRRHAYPATVLLVDQRHARDQFGITRHAFAHAVQPVLIELVNQLQMARQQTLEHRHRPGFQCFRHQRVIGVADRLPGDLPSRVPAQPVFVDQQAQQLDRCQRRMGIVEVDRVAQTQRMQIAEFAHMAGQQILQ